MAWLKTTHPLSPRARRARRIQQVLANRLRREIAAIKRTKTEDECWTDDECAMYLRGVRSALVLISKPIAFRGRRR